MIQSENADVSTNFGQSAVQNLPNPGGDITYIVQTTPGAVMNTQAGYGNFVVDGLPATMNLFTINGASDNDPFFGINNSGASNLLLGSNDISEANVITNPYSGQYGQAAGAQVTYITKSGTNRWHGNAIYNWNGRYLNANQFFSNSVGQPTPFNNFNQWQTNLNGPIIKNKTFFDFNYEGVHSVFPTASNLTLIPSPQFQAATLSNLAANGNAAEIPFYHQVFSVYNGAPGAGSAVPVAGGRLPGLHRPGRRRSLRSSVPQYTRQPDYGVPVVCESRPHIRRARPRLHPHGTRQRLPADVYQPVRTCFQQLQQPAPNTRPDIGDPHIWTEDGQRIEGSALFYSAVFTPSDPAAELAAMPTFMTFSGNAFTATGAFGEPGPFFFPQGRRIFQYQVLDDLSRIMGKHTFRMGFSRLDDNITDLDFSALAGPIHGNIVTNLTDFFNGGGVGTALNQAFPSQPQQYLRTNTFAGYVADDWKDQRPFDIVPEPAAGKLRELFLRQ